MAYAAPDDAAGVERRRVERLNVKRRNVFQAITESEWRNRDADKQTFDVHEEQAQRMERRLRLRDEADFRRIRAHGRSYGNRLLTLLVLPNGLPHNRYGFVTSKRVGKAVERNLVKRRLREILRHFNRAGRLTPGHDLAFIVRPPLTGATFDEAREAVAALLARARLLGPPEKPSGDTPAMMDRPAAAPGQARSEGGHERASATGATSSRHA